MEVAFEYTEEEPLGLSEAFLRDVAERTIRAALPETLSERRISLSAVAVSPDRIRELNRTYRDKDAGTDILSFGEYADTAALAADPSEELFIGELFFDPAFIRSAAEEDGVSLEREMAYIFSHGVLHLLGFDHSDEMFAFQDSVTDQCATV